MTETEPVGSGGSGGSGGSAGSLGRDVEALRARRAALRARYLAPPGQRPPSTARGIHHAAFICRDVEQTVRFYQDLLGFPLVEVTENRDYAGSTHFFFDLGNGNLLGFFDFPGLPLEPFREVYGAIQHLAISMSPAQFAAAKRRLEDAGISYLGPDRGLEDSVYFRDPDGIGVELIREELYVFEGRQLAGW